MGLTFRFDADRFANKRARFAYILDYPNAIRYNPTERAGMIVLRALDGTDVSVDESAITVVAGPYPHDVGPHTYVHGVEREVLVTAEEASALVARLEVRPPLVKLTRPDLTPVWLKGSAVSAIRAPLPTERQALSSVNAVVVVGDLHQAVHENVEAARGVLRLGGTHGDEPEF